MCKELIQFNSKNVTKNENHLKIPVKKQSEVDIVAQQIKPSLVMPTSHIRVTGSIPATLLLIPVPSSAF